MLFYTTIILLHRPFYSTPEHRRICRQAAFDIETLLRLSVKSFGVDHITYLQAYCIYTGASVLVRDVKAGNELARVKLDNLLTALRGGLTTCPILRRSIDIVERGLANREGRGSSRPHDTNTTSLPRHMAATQPTSSVRDPNLQWRTTGVPDWSIDSASAPAIQHTMDPQAVWPTNQDSNLWLTGTSDLGLPAFPFMAADLETAGNAPHTRPTMDTFNILDCFPEARMDQAQGDWMYGFSTQAG